MKADIPDKLVINRDYEGVLHHSYWTTDQQLIPFDDTEYIRKEALLEWLNRMLELSAQSLEFQRNYAYGKVIDKLNSM